MSHEPNPNPTPIAPNRDAHGRHGSGGRPGPGETVIEFFLEPPNPASERSALQPLIILTLAPTTSLVSWREDGSEPQRVPISHESAWLMPAQIPHSAHWHQAVPVVRVALGRDFPATVLPDERLRPRVVRLNDLTRMDWDIFEIVRELKLAIQAGATAVLPPARAQRLAARIIRGLQGPESYFNPSTMSDERFHAITDRIEANLTQKFTRAILAEADGHSLYHMARTFKARTRLTPREYIGRRRCFRARELIEQGRRQADVAPEVGFSDQPAMSEHFKKVFGCPPGTFAPKNRA